MASAERSERLRILLAVYAGAPDLDPREAMTAGATPLRPDELRLFRYPVIIGGGTPYLPPVPEDLPLELMETKAFGSRVIYERYRRSRATSA